MKAIGVQKTFPVLASSTVHVLLLEDSLADSQKILESYRRAGCRLIRQLLQREVNFWMPLLHKIFP